LSGFYSSLICSSFFSSENSSSSFFPPKRCCLPFFELDSAPDCLTPCSMSVCSSCFDFFSFLRSKLVLKPTSTSEFFTGFTCFYFAFIPFSSLLPFFTAFLIFLIVASSSKSSFSRINSKLPSEMSGYSSFTAARALCYFFFTSEALVFYIYSFSFSGLISFSSFPDPSPPDSNFFFLEGLYLELTLDFLKGLYLLLLLLSSSSSSGTLKFWASSSSYST